MSESLSPVNLVLALPDSDTEGHLDLPIDTRNFYVQCRESSVLRMAWVTGKVATPTEPYNTIKAAATENFEVQVNDLKRRVYFASPDDNVHVEVVAWVGPSSDVFATVMNQSAIDQPARDLAQAAQSLALAAESTANEANDTANDAATAAAAATTAAGTATTAANAASAAASAASTSAANASAAAAAAQTTANSAVSVNTTQTANITAVTTTANSAAANATTALTNAAAAATAASTAQGTANSAVSVNTAQAAAITAIQNLNATQDADIAALSAQMATKIGAIIEDTEAPTLGNSLNCANHDLIHANAIYIAREPDEDYAIAYKEEGDISRVTVQGMQGLFNVIVMTFNNMDGPSLCKLECNRGAGVMSTAQLPDHDGVLLVDSGFRMDAGGSGIDMNGTSLQGAANLGTKSIQVFDDGSTPATITPQTMGSAISLVLPAFSGTFALQADISDALAIYLPLTGGTMGGDIDMGVSFNVRNANSFVVMSTIPGGGGNGFFAFTDGSGIRSLRVQNDFGSEWGIYVWNDNASDWGGFTAKYIDAKNQYFVNGTQVVGPQQAGPVDAAEDLADLTAKFNQLLAALRQGTGHGLITNGA